MSTQIHRHFVTVHGRWGARQVHYRRAGEGPPLVMLHQSPKSSREYEPLMDRWREHFTVIAPDTPGFGQSDPLPVTRTTLEELADCLIEFADAVGLDSLAVYGFHTGGGIAVALADAYPERVCVAVANGLIMPTGEERAEILEHYLPPFEPRWDGSHLTWAWARMREQTVFFPWFAQDLAHRMDYTIPGPGALQENLRELLQSGDHYRVGYRAALEYDAAPALARLKVPTLVTAARLDPLSAHLGRIGARSKCLEVRESSDGEAALARALELLRAHARGRAPAAPPAEPLAGRIWQDTVQLESGPVRLLRHGVACRTLVVHGAAGSARTLEGLVHDLGEAAAMDLPGHGEHARALDCDLSVAECARSVADVVGALGVGPLLLVGEGSGAWVALEAARLQPERFRGVLLVDPPADAEEVREAIRREGLPSMAPDWHGGHLGRAWHCNRDAHLFQPWFRRNPQGIRWIDPELDPVHLTLEVREMLSAEGHWQSLVREALEFPAGEYAASLTIPLAVSVSGRHPNGGAATDWAKDMSATLVPMDAAAWPSAILAWLNGADAA